MIIKVEKKQAIQEEVNLITIKNNIGFEVSLTDLVQLFIILVIQIEKEILDMQQFVLKILMNFYIRVQILVN